MSSEYLTYATPPLYSVFKPKDEEPYGRLNPKVNVCGPHKILVYGWYIPNADNQMDTSAISMDHSLWTCLSYSKSEVRLISSVLRSALSVNIYTLATYPKLQRRCWTGDWT